MEREGKRRACQTPNWLARSKRVAVPTAEREPSLPREPGERLTGCTSDKAHCRWERRSLVTTTALNEYLTWPDSAQVLRRTCRRIPERTGLAETEVTYGITGLPTALAGTAQLQRIRRDHWTIENHLHYVRDETFDRSLPGAYRHCRPTPGGHAQRRSLHPALPRLEQSRRRDKLLRRRSATHTAIARRNYAMKSPWYAMHAAPNHRLGRAGLTASNAGSHSRWKARRAPPAVRPRSA